RRHLKEATVTVASPKSVKAGQHYDVMFGDDIVNEQNFRNPELMKKAIEDFSLYVPLIDPGGYKYVTGTRYVFGDLYEHIIRHNEKGDWIISIKECWFTVEEAGTKVKKPLFPRQRLDDGRLIGFTIEMLEQMQRDDPQMFAAQYLNRPIAAETQLFPEELVLSRVKATSDQDFPALMSKVLFIDLATSGDNDD